jgi:hypothetical protein
MTEVVKRGRPQLPDNEKKIADFRVPCTLAERQAVVKAAKQSGLSVAQFVRLIIFRRNEHEDSDS